MPPARRPILFIGAIVLALTSLIAISQWRAAHTVERITWRKDLPAAKAEAASQHKRVFAYFTATWCGPCQRMKQTTWADPVVGQAMEKRYLAVKLDIDDQPAAAKSFGIEAVPTFIILSDNGTEIRRNTGYQDEKGMSDWLEQ